MKSRIFALFPLLLALTTLTARRTTAFPVDPPTPPLTVALRKVLSGLDSPTSIANAGDGRLFVTEQPGRIVVVDHGALQPAPFLDLSSLVTAGGERGLLGLAFHPRYAQNGLFFVYYNDLSGADTIARYQVSREDPGRADPGSGRILLRVPKPFDNHDGGQLQLGPDGYLYAGTGDGGAGGDPNCFAQQWNTLLGKLLRLDVDSHAATAPYYDIPADNPFRSGGFMPPEVWAYGLRNPWRFSFDRQTGDLYIADVGQSRREEIDFQPAGTPGGRNYGWKVMEGSSCFATDACPASTPPCHSPRLTLPVLDYGHGEECAVTGGYVSRSRSLPQAWGAYFFGDFCSGRLWTAERIAGAWQVRKLPVRAPSVSTFGQGSDGELYLATLDGSLYQLVPQRPTDTVGLFDPATARFFFKDLDVDGVADRMLRFGTPGGRAFPLAGDWNGDGRTTVGLYDPATATFVLKNTLLPGPADIVFRVDSPSAGALPIAGDWNGDGKDGVGLYDPATATFYLKNSLVGSGFDVVFRFGTPRGGQIPVAGDWNGDGRDGVGLYDPRTATFTLKDALVAGPADQTLRFGTPGGPQKPFAGDWDGDGKDGVGLYDPRTGTVQLVNTLRRGAVDAVFRFGPPRNAWVPLAGEW